MSMNHFKVVACVFCSVAAFTIASSAQAGRGEGGARGGRAVERPGSYHGQVQQKSMTHAPVQANTVNKGTQNRYRKNTNVHMNQMNNVNKTNNNMYRKNTNVNVNQVNNVNKTNNNRYRTNSNVHVNKVNNVNGKGSYYHNGQNYNYYHNGSYYNYYNNGSYYNYFNNGAYYMYLVNGMYYNYYYQGKYYNNCVKAPGNPQKMICQ